MGNVVYFLERGEALLKESLLICGEASQSCACARGSRADARVTRDLGARRQLRERNRQRKCDQCAWDFWHFILIGRVYGRCNFEPENGRKVG